MAVNRQLTVDSRNLLSDKSDGSDGFRIVFVSFV